MIGWFFCFFAVTVWGITFVNTRFLLSDFSSLEIMLVRFVIAWLALCIWGVAKERESMKWTGRGEWLFAAMGLTGVFAYQFLENCAIHYTNASNVAILVSVVPIVTGIFARMFSNDRSLSRRAVIGSLIAMFGTAFVSLNGVLHLDMHPLGDLMALGAMVSWGVYSVLIAKVGKYGLSAMATTRKSFAWALLMMVPVVAWGTTDGGFDALNGSFRVTLDCAHNHERFMRPLNWLNFGFLGLFASAISFAFWSRACESIGIVRTAICLNFEPVVAVAFAAVFLGEDISFASVLGGGAIIMGVLTASSKPKTDD